MKISLVSIPVQDPIAAHEIYTKKLGFVSKQLDESASLAIVASKEEPNGTMILLEPCKGSFTEDYQSSAYKENLPIMCLSTSNLKEEMKRLTDLGIKLRPELDKPEWGIMNVFEDGCGNLLMLEKNP